MAQISTGHWYNPGPIFAEYTAVIVAQGSSLDVEQARKIAEIYPTVALKDTYEFIPNAQIIYACDRSWWFERWKTDEPLRAHKADRVVLDYSRMDTRVPDLHWLKCDGNHGFSLKPGFVKHGRNSGHQAIDFVAGTLGARKIILMGYDMCAIDGKTHFNSRHVAVPHSVFDDFFSAMMQAAPLLVKKGIQVINTSMRSRLTCFPKVPFDDAIEWGRST